MRGSALWDIPVGSTHDGGCDLADIVEAERCHDTTHTRGWRGRKRDSTIRPHTSGSKSRKASPSPATHDWVGRA